MFYFVVRHLILSLRAFRAETTVDGLPRADRWLVETDKFESVGLIE